MLSADELAKLDEVRVLPAEPPGGLTELQLAIADHVVARGNLEIGPGQNKTKRFLATLPPGTRATDATVSGYNSTLSYLKQQIATWNTKSS